jgi:hypothetical protein
MSNGVQNYVGIGKETTYGTEVAPTVYLPIKPSDGIKINQDIQMNEAIKGTAPKNKAAFIGKIELSGSFDSDIYPAFMGHLLLSALGAVNSAVVSGSVYKHTFTEALTKASYTVEQKIGEVLKRFSGFIVKNLKVETKSGEPVTVSFEGMAKAQADNAGSSPTYETSRAFNFKDVSLVQIGAVDMTAKVADLKLEYDNGLNPFYAVGDNNLKSQYPTPSECKGSFTMYLDSATLAMMTDYIAKTERALEIKIEGDIAGGAVKYTLRLIISRAIFTAVSTKLDTDYNALEVEFDALEHATDGILKVELTNLATSY